MQMNRFASNPIDRRQVTLFRPTLEESIELDHPVRLYDEILANCQWASWESQYCLAAGQPPIHPQIMASIILYGLGRGIRSSRVLEYMCYNSMDYIWLAQGHRPDHSTFCKFRNQFDKELKGLFRQIAQVAIDMKLASLAIVGLDGSRIRANSSRHSTASQKTIEENLKEIDTQIEKIFAEIDQNDTHGQDLFGQGSPSKLPAELADLKSRQERLNKALEAVKKKTDKADGKSKKTPHVPVTDPEATILPNKEGGYAPNYTVFATTESNSGFIMDAEVIIGGDESRQTLETVDRIEESFGEKPEILTADRAFSSGENLAGLEERDVVAYMPQFNRPDQTNNPANREDPSEPVPSEAWDKLPRDTQSKKLHRMAFVFDETANCYYCPMGRKLNHIGKHTKPRKHGNAAYQAYRSNDCSKCELSEQCLNGKKLPRSVCREQHEELREAMDVRMASAAGKKIYRQRNWIAETPFAIIKDIMNVRQFLTREINKVRTEWLWTCTSFNLAKLVRLVAALRAETAKNAG
jgi:transposase